MSNKPVIVRLGQGDLKGSACRNAEGVEYFSFQGIPYAHPPLGQLRFKAPVPAGPWDQDVLDCRQDPPQCYQRHGIRINEIGGSEDCLYLNVYTPEYKFQRRKPVMVCIHGRAFINGSNNIELCGPEYFMNNNVVLVQVNYRVGLLGFLSMEDNSLGVPGNAGLKDQVLALKWIRRNIQEFGGNARNITIFGHGVGSASCHLHMLSPMSKKINFCVCGKAVSCAGNLLHHQRQYCQPPAKRCKFTTRYCQPCNVSLPSISFSGHLRSAQHMKSLTSDTLEEGVKLLQTHSL